MALHDLMGGRTRMGKCSREGEGWARNGCRRSSASTTPRYLHVDRVERCAARSRFGAPQRVVDKQPRRCLQELNADHVRCGGCELRRDDTLVVAGTSSRAIRHVEAARAGVPPNAWDSVTVHTWCVRGEGCAEWPNFGVVSAMRGGEECCVKQEALSSAVFAPPRAWRRRAWAARQSSTMAAEQ